MSTRKFYVDAAATISWWGLGAGTGWSTEWWVMSRSKRGGDRRLAIADSKTAARRIVAALNAASVDPEPSPLGDKP